MPAPKSKAAAAANGGEAHKARVTKVAASSGKSTPAISEKSLPESTLADFSYGSGSSKPDKAAYDADQASIKSEIDALQTKISAVKDKISGANRPGGSSSDRRNALRTELDGLRDQQANSKTTRSKIFDQLKVLQDNIQKKTKDLNASKSKTPFKTVADVDQHVKNLEKQVESGNLKIAEEKRALQEISNAKRARRTVESFQTEQAAIDADKAAADALRQQLDDPEAKAASQRFDEIKAELDEIKREDDKVYANRSKLFEERDSLQTQINALFEKKRASMQRFREANDRFYTKLNEDRARRAEKARQQRDADEKAKKLEIAERLREEASIPAFQYQIEDCQTLIDYFSGKSSGTSFKSAPSPSDGAKPAVAGVDPLELRKVEAGPDEGMIVRKKKGEDDEVFYAGKAKKNKKGGSKPAEAASSSTSGLHVPLPTLSALLSLSIPPPTSSADIPRVIGDLQTKKAWFEANQSRVTAESVAKAEAEIQRLTGSKPESKEEDAPAAAAATEDALEDISPPNGGAEKPAEPASTPQVSDLPETAAPADVVDEKLEEVTEDIAAEAEGDAAADAAPAEEEEEAAPAAAEDDA